MRGTFKDFPHGGGERNAAAGTNGDASTDELVGQGGGIALEERTQGAIGELGGFPAGERDGGLGGGELAVEGFGEDAADPGRDVDVAFGTEPCEALTQLGFDAALDILVSLHYMT